MLHRPCRIAGIMFLGATSLVAVGGMIWLETQGLAIPASLTTIAATCVGALAGVLPSGSVRETSSVRQQPKHADDHGQVPPF